MWDATLLVGIPITSNGIRGGGCKWDMAKLFVCGRRSRSGNMRGNTRWRHMERNTDRHVRKNTPLWIEGRREGEDDQEELLEVREPLTDFVPSIFMVDLVLGMKR